MLSSRPKGWRWIIRIGYERVLPITHAKPGGCAVTTVVQSHGAGLPA
jgi:hypothetical protein